MAKKSGETPLDSLHQDHEWLCRQDLAPYVGEWIAVHRKRIVDHDRDLGRLLTRLRGTGQEDEALLVPIPSLPVAA